MPEHDILTLEEVAEYLRVSERTVYDWANKGEIPCGKLGTTWRFKRSEVERWVDRKIGGGRAARPEAILLKDILTPERVLRLQSTSKQDALDALVDVLAAAPEVRNRDELAREVDERENLMSTGIGFGIAVPHVRLASVKDLVMAVGVNDRGLEDYASLDDEPVRIICMVAARDGQHAQYLKTLAAISGLLKETEVRTQLLEASEPNDIYDILTSGA